MSSGTVAITIAATRGVDMLLARGDSGNDHDHLNRCVGRRSSRAAPAAASRSHPRGARAESSPAPSTSRAGRERRRGCRRSTATLDEEIRDAPDRPRKRRERAPCPPAQSGQDCNQALGRAFRRDPLDGARGRSSTNWRLRAPALEGLGGVEQQRVRGPEAPSSCRPASEPASRPTGTLTPGTPVRLAITPWRALPASADVTPEGSSIMGSAESMTAAPPRAQSARRAGRSDSKSCSEVATRLSAQPGRRVRWGSHPESEATGLRTPQVEARRAHSGSTRSG